MASDIPAINRTVADFVPRGPERLAAAIDGDWLRAPIRLERLEDGDLMVCEACLGSAAHERYQPGNLYRQMTTDYLAVTDEARLLDFVRRWGMISPVSLVTGAPDPRHDGAGTVEPVELALFSTGNARYAQHYALRPGASDDVEDAAREANRRQAFAGLQLELRGMTVRFAELDEPMAVKFIPTSLRQVVGLALLAMFRSELPIACGVCGAVLPAPDGPGRPRLYCSQRCADHAAYAKRRRASARSRQTPIAAATSGQTRSASPSNRRK